jgi:citrate lyase subunit beta/citryl-CoA lyase
VSDRWRSVLFVPGNRPDLAAKATRWGPDLVVLDLEDAVPAAAKDDARALVDESVSLLSGAVPVAVRVNPPGTAWFGDDAAALPRGLDAVVVPKLDDPSTVDEVAEALAGRPVVAGIETVRGVADARAVLRAPVAACYFGAEDYVADLGGVRTETNDEVALARAWVAMAARLAGVAALDMVTLSFGDDERFRREATEARALGYGGKLCIHPAQVALANEAFRPSDDEVDWARRVLDAFQEAGGMTIGFEGLMVDEVVAARARAILDGAGADRAGADRAGADRAGAHGVGLHGSATDRSGGPR